MSKYSTVQRKVLTDFLKSNHDRLFTVKQISDALTDRGISMSAVYRNLNELESEGLVSRSAFEGSREMYYQYIDPEHCENRIHLTCTECGKTLHLCDGAARALNEAVRSEGFCLSPSKSTIYGICEKCGRERK